MYFHFKKKEIIKRKKKHYSDVVGDLITLSIIVNDSIRNYVLNDFTKERISFGRGEYNDIIIKSPIMSKYHGYFEIKGSKVYIHDDQSKNGIIVNNKKTINAEITDGDFIRIDDENEHLNDGILIIVKYGKSPYKWNRYHINNKNVITIGNVVNNDVIIDYNVNSQWNVRLTKKDKENSYTIEPCFNKSVFLNGNEVKKPTLLKNNDLINIDSYKIIYTHNNIFFHTHELGVRIDARDITKVVKVRGKKKIISNDINMTIKPGEFVAFVGGSGTGKTTFMSFISGMKKPTKGTVLLDGKDLFKNYNSLKKVIAYVPQNDIVYTDLTLIDMLRYSANLRMDSYSNQDEKERRIQDVLEIVDLVGKENVLIKRLSGGQRKRAGIAVELLDNPKLFFLDEPTSGLDPGTERSLMKTLRKMSDMGQTTVLVTHNTQNIHLCDKVVFFGNGGKICYDGPPVGAKEFFGVDDFVDIYNLIDADTDFWNKKYKKESNIEKITNENEETNKTKKTKNSFIDQFITLTKRYIKTIINNKIQLLLLLLQAPIIAEALSLVINNDLFTYYDMTKSILFIIAIAGIYIGLGNSIQEICKEKIILKKEYMADLRLSAYILSKILVMFILAIIQSSLFIFTLKLTIDVPTDGVMYSWTTEMWIIMILTIFSSSTMGLLVSSLAQDASTAMTYIPILLVPQMLFCGMLFELKGIISIISNFILCRWTLELLGTTNDMNSLIVGIQDIIPGYQRESETFFEFTKIHFCKGSLVIVFMSIIMILICYLILKKQLEDKS